jgi:hypothetical protein
MKIDKIEVSSDNGKVHAILENPEELKAMGIDALEEAKILVEHEAQLEQESEQNPYIAELQSINEDLVFIGDTPEQYVDAIVGVTYDSNHVIYDVDKFINLMMVQDGMTYEEAEDWVSYNTARAIPYMGECAPILMYSREG